MRYLNAPDSQTRIQPTPIFLPHLRRLGIDDHKDISLTQLHALPTIDESVRSTVLIKCIAIGHISDFSAKYREDIAHTEIILVRYER
jgi:hypothetical protein